MAKKNSTEETKPVEPTEKTPEQKARMLELRKKYLENTVVLRFNKTEADKFGIEVSESDTPVELAKKVKVKFDIKTTMKVGGSNMVPKMEKKLTDAGIDLPVVDDPKKYYSALRNAITKLAMKDL